MERRGESRHRAASTPRPRSTIGPDETADELRARLVELGTDLLLGVLEQPLDGSEGRRRARAPTPAKLDPAELELDWGRPAERVAPAGAGRRRRGRRCAGTGSRCCGRRSAEIAVARPGRSRARRSARAHGDPAARRGPARGPVPCAGRRLGPGSPDRTRRPIGYVSEALAGWPSTSSGASRRTGRYANLVVPSTLDRSGLERARSGLRHRARLRRDPHAAGVRLPRRPLPPPPGRSARPGGPPPRRLPAALPADARPTPPWGRPSPWLRRRARGLVNAVLRRVAEAPVVWPDEATRLSYPDWVVDRLTADLGRADAIAALEQMNEPAAGHRAPRRLRPGPRLPVGGRAGRGSAGRTGRRPLRRARAARRRRWPSTASTLWRATSTLAGPGSWRPTSTAWGSTGG